MKLVKNFFLILIATTLFSLSASAQRPAMNRDVVHLKDGSKIRGKILQLTDSTIRIRTKGGSEWVFASSEMKEITREPMRFERSATGYQGFLEGSLLFGQGEYSNVGGGIMLAHGVRYKKVWFGGIGASIESLGNGIGSFYGDVRYSLLEGDVRPILFGKAGYGWQLDGNWGGYDYHGGPLLEGGVGLVRHYGSAFGLSFNLGYRFQQQSYTYTNSWDGAVSEVTDIYNRITFRFGFTF